MRVHALCALVLALASSRSLAQPTPTSTAGPPADAYAWADECKACHPAVHDAWAKTKHARTINRLSADERRPGSPCVGCHVTGREPFAADGQLLNANVQCESCHGPGKAHVEAARAGAAKVPIERSPADRTCQACHNDRSPHFRGFFFSALKGLVHKH